jgi:glycosyltransferase involved in cell wall biosynthesis
MTNGNLLISVIIPCRNEEKFIANCLNSLIKQDWPKEKLEILVVDGNSEDGTREIVKNFTKDFSFIKIFDNPKKFTPFGLNIGIREAKGEIIMRIDAHADYEKNYISKCVKYLIEFNADNVGGVIKTLPAENTIVAKAIAISLSSQFGAVSDFRIGSNSQKEVDTVFGGCYRKEVFEKIGFFNEKLIRSQDLEFNLRLKKAGGKIILFPDIVVSYYPQSTLINFFRHNFQDGIWSIYPLKFVKITFKLRHYLPLIFVGSLTITGILAISSHYFLQLFLFVIFLYLFVSLYFSLKIIKKENSFYLLFFMPIVFAIRHIAYGFGSIYGLIKIFKD